MVNNVVPSHQRNYGVTNYTRFMKMSGPTEWFLIIAIKHINGPDLLRNRPSLLQENTKVPPGNGI